MIFPFDNCINPTVISNIIFKNNIISNNCYIDKYCKSHPYKIRKNEFSSFYSFFS